MADRRLTVLSILHALAVALVLTILYIVLPTFSLLYAVSAYLIVYFFIAYFTYDFSKWCFCSEKIEPENKAVFITGCDSGFGHEAAKRLDSRGFRVFATCLFPEGPGATELKKTCSDKLRVLYMDVTKDESVEKALSFVKQNLGDSELWAVVNNAGICMGTLLDFTPIDTFRKVIEVNSIGPVRVTKAFLPLLRKSKGRIVNITSLGGRITNPVTCAYEMSKYAAVAFTECLSQEMKIWGVRAISVEPEAFRTAMCNAKNRLVCFEEELNNLSQDVLTLYEDDFKKKMKKFLIRHTESAPSNTPVINSIESAIMDKYPNYVYKPRRNIITRMSWYLAEIMPYWLYECILLKVLYTLGGLPIPKNI